MLLPSWPVRCRTVAASFPAGGALLPWPLRADAVLGGTPSLRGRLLSAAADGTPTGGVWEVDACRLELQAGSDELLAVLAGELVIQTDDGDTVQLQQGDVASLPGGVTYLLTVSEHCRVACHVSTGTTSPAPSATRGLTHQGAQLS